MKLSFREKILLTILGLVILVGMVGRFLIFPVIQNYIALNESSMVKTEKKQNILTVINVYGNSGELLEEETKKAKDLNYFCKDIDGSYIDDFLQKKASAEGIALKSVKIDIPDFADEKEKEAVESEKNKNKDTLEAQKAAADEMLEKVAEENLKVLGMGNAYKEEESDTAADAVQGKIETTEEDKPHLMVYKCDVEASGDMDKIINFVSSLNDKNKAIIVSNFVVDEKEEKTEDEAVAAVTSEAKMTVEFYYIEGFEY